MNLKLVGLGEILWDMFPAGKKLGGAPANFAYHSNALGAEGIPVSSVGKDQLGDEILENLRNFKLRTDFIQTEHSHPTGTVLVSVSNDGIPQYIIRENVAWDYISPSPDLLNLAEKADAVCFGSLVQRSEMSRNTIRNFLKKTRTDALRIFDINLRQTYYSRETITQSLSAANILKINDEELNLISKMFQFSDSPEDSASILLKTFKLKILAVTMGGRGSVLLDADGRKSEHPGFPAKIADTVGAGDSFTAALAIGLLKGFSLDKINDGANRIASYVCSQPGATPQIPNELKSMFA